MNTAQNGTERYTKHTNEDDWLGYVSHVVCYLFRLFSAKRKTERERGLATMLPGNPKFFNQDEFCPGFRGQS